MINLQLIFWAGAFTGNATLTRMAVAHAGVPLCGGAPLTVFLLRTTSISSADTTLKYWFQPWCDGCVWHLVIFNETTGAVLSRSSTPQGLSTNSVWSRGHAWAVNGFTLAYRCALAHHRYNVPWLRHPMSPSRSHALECRHQV